MESEFMVNLCFSELKKKKPWKLYGLLEVGMVVVRFDFHSVFFFLFYPSLYNWNFKLCCLEDMKLFPVYQ